MGKRLDGIVQPFVFSITVGSNFVCVDTRLTAYWVELIEILQDEFIEDEL